MKQASLTIVDSHQHFWQLSRGDYSWLTPELTILYKDFLPEDFCSAIANKNITQSVLVQAADTDAETDFMLSLAQQNNFIAGVVGWIDWTLPFDDIKKRLTFLAEQPKFKGLRPMLQDIEDLDWIINPDFDDIFKLMVELGLRFDALVKTEHLSRILLIAKRYPDLKIVIDHCAKPNIKDGEMTDWSVQLTQFSTLKNVFVKVSGLPTEASSEQTQKNDFIQYFQHVNNVFGAARMMWGSDWPVVNLNSSYGAWLALSEELISDWSNGDKQSFWSTTAKNFYQLEINEA